MYNNQKRQRDFAAGNQISVAPRESEMSVWGPKSPLQRCSSHQRPQLRQLLVTICPQHNWAFMLGFLRRESTEGYLTFLLWLMHFSGGTTNIYTTLFLIRTNQTFNEPNHRV
jgi:hypothetical protein